MISFQIGRTPIKIHPLTPVIFALDFVFGGVAFTLALIWSLAMHEYAHIAFARSFGMTVGCLRLMPFGGEITLEERAPPRASLAISAAGPAASVVMAAAAALFSELFPSMRAAMQPFLSTSLTLAAFNLLPSPPLDGGSVVKAALLLFIGEGTAAKIVAMLGYVIGGGALGLGVLLLLRGELTQFLMLGPFLLLSARREGKTPWKALRRPAQKRAALKGGMNGRLFVAPHDMPASEAVRELSPGAFNVIAVVDDSLRIVGEMGEAELLSGLIALGPDADLGGVLKAQGIDAQNYFCR